MGEDKKAESMHNTEVQLESCMLGGRGQIFLIYVTHAEEESVQRGCIVYFCHGNGSHLRVQNLLGPWELGH